MVGVQGLSRRRRLHPCHVANAGVGRAHGVGKTLGGRAVGDIVPQALILRVLGSWVYKAQSQLCVALLGVASENGQQSTLAAGVSG